MNKKKYMINDESASANDIIRKAKELDSSYGQDGLCQTSVAAAILRQHGYKIEHNKEISS